MNDKELEHIEKISDTYGEITDWIRNVDAGQVLEPNSIKWADKTYPGLVHEIRAHLSILGEIDDEDTMALLLRFILISIRRHVTNG